MENLVSKLSDSALKIGHRTLVTDIFVREGFKISKTDFDDVVFENNGTTVKVAFDINSQAKSVVRLF